MITTDLEFYNDYFSNLADIVKIKDFEFNDETKYFEGEIKYLSNKGELKFLIRIPKDYPFNSLTFVAKDFAGYPHQNFDGSLCLNTEFINHSYTRLNLEIKKFRTYISEYFEKGKEDDNYEYSSFDSVDNVTLLFEENDFNSERFKVPFGNFDYSVLGFNQNDKNKITQITVYAQNLGNKAYCWSETYKKKDIFSGCWVFLDKEPVHSKKHRITEWKDLARIFPANFSEFFREFCKRSADYKLVPRGMNLYILLAVGYKIPNNDSFEVHWDLSLLPRCDFPRKFYGSSQLIHSYIRPVLWDKTYNISYERFFGRGSIDKNFSNKKMLIIGNGAIGSSVAEILTRGGARKIDLTDIEAVEPGNICRSTYSLSDISFSKARTLKITLENISPFVEVRAIDNLKAVSIMSSEGKDIYEILRGYEIIFDCTANNEILQMLTDLSLPNTIFYLSMSDKAKEMVCVCNVDNPYLIERRNQMLYSLEAFKEAEFREGTGCWHPTFEASFFDINQLLNYTIRRINDFFKNGLKPKSFYSFNNEDSIGFSEDIHFIQPELNLKLIIVDKCLKRIENFSRQHYPDEFGGILTGSYLNDYKHVVISDVICPDNFFSSPYRFEPDHLELNKKLKKLYKRFGGKIEYVGDWHSHPNGTNHFSPSDFKSIQDVAKSNKVNTYSPVLLIAAYNKSSFDPGFYVYFEGKIYKFIRE